MKPKTDVLSEICSDKRGVDPETLRRIVTLAVELAREGREGRKVGTIFVVGDADAVMERSRPLVMDPLRGHPDEEKFVGDPNVREALKEFAQLDGAFVISDNGVAISAARYLDSHSEGLEMLQGLGSRHMAAASISRDTKAVAVVVSESGVVRMFDDGELVGEILPELWIMNRFNSQIQAPVSENTDEGLTVLSRAED